MRNKTKIFFFIVSASLGLLILFASIFHTQSVQNSTMVNAAASYSNALTLFRAYYSKHILDIVKNSEGAITHDFHNHNGAFPLPATMTHELSKFSMEHGNDVSFVMTSEFPFPWRQTRQLTDFQKRALETIKNGSKNYTEIINDGKKKFIHYADPVFLENSCVSCHNEHPDTPKSDWEVGQIRGIQEVVIPIPNYAFNISWSLIQLLVIVAIMLILSFVTINLLFRFLEKKNEVLAIINQRTRDLETSYEKLAQAKSSEFKAIKSKSQLLAAMSHEIRTPLNGIIGLINLISEDNLSQEQKKDIASIKNCSTSLVHIVNDILDFSKIESGKMLLNNIHFNPAELTREIIDLFKAKAKAKEQRIDLIINKNEKLPELVFGDESKIKQILFNLVGNAIKFTPKGHVKVTIRCEKIDAESLRLILEVEDTGVGISQACIDKVFNIFEQGENQSTIQCASTGLGLAISKKLAQIMSGDISCQSVVGEGTLFTCSIKVQIPTQSHQSVSSDSLIANQDSKSFFDGLETQDINVLVVEDNHVNQQVINRMLKNLGLEVQLADNGVEAIKLWQQFQHDIILMDIEMPIKNGFETTKDIRSKSSSDEWPIIIALTANTEASIQAKCFEWGMNDFLSKPFKPDSLKKKMRFFCQKVYTRKTQSNQNKS